MPVPQQKPSKEAVRVYTQKRFAAKAPPPDAAEIRRQLGWGMLANKSAECAR